MDKTVTLEHVLAAKIKRDLGEIRAYCKRTGWPSRMFLPTWATRSKSLIDGIPDLDMNLLEQLLAQREIAR